MINFAENLNKMITAGLGGETEAPRTEVAVGHRIQYLDASGPVASFETNIVAPLKRLLVTMLPIQAGSGDPSPENIRQISGRESLNITRSGRNLLPAIETTIEGGMTFTQIGDYIDITGERTGNAYVYFYRNKVFPAGEYTFSGHPDASSTSFRLGVKIGSGSYAYTVNNPRTYVSDGITPWTIGLFVYRSYDHLRLQYEIEYGDSLNGYEPPAMDDYSIDFQQTVYGGLLDVAAGKMTVTWAAVDMGSLEWTRDNSSTSYYYFMASIADKALDFQFDCSMYKNIHAIRTFLTDYTMGLFNTNNATSYRRVVVRDDRYTSADDFKTAVTGQTICYALASPLTINLTPQQITTLIGDNNIWSDAGDVDLTYTYYEETEGY